MKQQTPLWLDESLYPFSHRHIDLPSGRMHYVDEGQGEVLLFVHGTPAWSFLYREQIKTLRTKYRCIAMDHIGFGLSDKPGKFDGTPQAHSANLSLFAEKLGLANITLVVHDFGGPIGLSFALAHPEKVKKLVILNTWLWKTAHNPDVQKVDKAVNSRLGKFIYLHTNFSPSILMKKAFHNKSKLTKAIHRHYIRPFPDEASRWGLLQLAQSLLGSSDWYEEQFEQLHKWQGKPALILWGTKDQFIKPAFLDRWKEALPRATIRTFDVGHFVQEEAPQEVCDAIGDFVQKSQLSQVSNAAVSTEN
ncbi:MAG: alpha/beta fold hydrolase [Imperialibacter sp.]|uniref:alpha/beta fold hydrolase n=1 Tax=Imperialibacter sp. TaxID=2038411 RepID=UPI0032EB7A6C